MAGWGATMAGGRVLRGGRGEGERAVSESLPYSYGAVWSSDALRSSSARRPRSPSQGSSLSSHVLAERKREEEPGALW